MNTVIGISFDRMSEAKIGSSRARDAAEVEKRNLILARTTLEATGSQTLRISADVINDQIKSVNARINDIDRIMQSIDYATRKFQEVDEGCASRIKNTSTEFRNKS